MFSQEERYILNKNQLGDVICQLRFPEILLITAKAPVDFQEEIRQDFPQYACLKKKSPATSALPAHQPAESNAPSVIHQFSSADGKWKVLLCSSSISLSCSNYVRWEEFANMLDKPLAAFIKIYKPAYFQRIGLRYLNFISKKSLSLEHEKFSSLIHAPYLGILADDEIYDNTVSRCSVDVELGIRSGCRAKIHAGPGLIKKNGVANNEVHFILDLDIYMPGNIPVNLSAGAMQTLHSQAYSIFRGAITDTLFDAMGPSPL